MAAQSTAVMEAQASEPEWNEERLVSSLARLKEMHIQVINHSHPLQQYMESSLTLLSRSFAISAVLYVG